MRNHDGSSMRAHGALMAGLLGALREIFEPGQTNRSIESANTFSPPTGRTTTQTGDCALRSAASVKDGVVQKKTQLDFF